MTEDGIDPAARTVMVVGAGPAQYGKTAAQLIALSDELSRSGTRIVIHPSLHENLVLALEREGVAVQDAKESLKRLGVIVVEPVDAFAGLKQMQQYEPPAHVVYQGPPTGKRIAQWKQERRGYR